MALQFNKKELALIKKLNTPARIQDYLNSIPKNFEKDGRDTVKSPVRVMRENNAHCIEGALLGAYILSQHGFPPLLLNLSSTKKDYDHVVAPFKIGDCWGALSKTNQSVLRYREPVYKTIRELAMSYFHEYFLDDGLKTMRKFSRPLNLNIFQSDWPFLEDDLWGIAEELDNIKYYDVAVKKTLKSLRKADAVERKAGLLLEWE